MKKTGNTSEKKLNILTHMELKKQFLLKRKLRLIKWKL